MKIVKTFNRQFSINLLLGVGLISIPFLTSPDLSSGMQMLEVPPFQRSFLSYFLLLIFFYLNFYVLVPKFYFTKKWGWLLFIAAVYYVLILKVPEVLIQDKLPPTKPNENFLLPMHKPNMVWAERIFSRDHYFFQFIVVFLLSSFLKIDEQLHEIKKEKLTTEVSFLKAQINPHFLFNTLNSLYALTLTKSDEAPAAILKLSNLMRHVVTESNQDYVSLQNEIKYIQDFINLQKLRLTENISLTTQFSGDFSNCKIAPLLLINFIENAFKYGVNAEDEAKIVVDIYVNKQKTLTLRVENTIVKTANKQATQQGEKNAQKRLETLYPKKHTLHISKNKTDYAVVLTLQLK